MATQNATGSEVVEMIDIEKGAGRFTGEITKVEHSKVIIRLQEGHLSGFMRKIDWYVSFINHKEDYTFVILKKNMGE